MKRLPAEWEPQRAVLLTWPHDDSDWAPLLKRVHATYFSIIDALLDTTPVIVAVRPDLLDDLQVTLNKSFSNKPYAISLYPVDSDDTWARDHGPITVIENQQTVLCDFTFNGWGNKFSSQLDNAITNSLHKKGAFGKSELTSITIVLEGGAIESDGNACLMTTRECLQNPNRNSQLSQADIEKELRHYLGTQKFLWLDHGYLAGDDTDSHIDTLARFTPGNSITYVACDDPADAHYDALRSMEEQLASFTNINGESYTLIPLPWPSAKYDEEQERLPATYANYLISNGQVLVPIYNDKKDEEALRQIAKAFPGYKITGINCLSLIEQHGSLHCITMQIPETPNN